MRMVPVADPGQDDSLEVCQDRFHGFAFGRTSIGEQSVQFAGIATSSHLMLPGVLQVIRNPFDKISTVSAKLLRGHVPAVGINPVVWTGFVFTHDDSLVQMVGLLSGYKKGQTRQILLLRKWRLRGYRRRLEDGTAPRLAGII